jgi:SSS family solute:Na+ symporter
MAQNFWIAIFAWSVCFVVTVVVSLMSAPKAQSALHNLVYGLTEIQHEHVPWYQRPAPLALIVAAALVVLNVLFW